MLRCENVIASVVVNLSLFGCAALFVKVLLTTKQGLSVLDFATLAPEQIV
jgi:hypothetical protein